jgi:hypothetical protein
LARSRILPAADADGRRERAPDEKRAWAERWLRERRWEDVDPPAVADTTAQRVRALRQELAGLAASRARGIAGTEPREAAIQAEIAQLGGGHGKPA